MNTWLDPLQHALDRALNPVTFFFRDDDIGWDDQRLFALLEVFAMYGAPLDLAVIPAALAPQLAYRLGTWIEEHPEQIGIHQHGYTHTNHELEGRKCEFGSTRTPNEQRQDILLGRQRLEELLGSHIQPIFTPPWNRCVEATGTILAELHFRVLSRSTSAAPLAIEQLDELPIRIDWQAKRKGVHLSLVELGYLLADATRIAEPLGVMFHHAQLDSEQRSAISEFLRLLAAHPAVRWASMWALAGVTDS